jgi:Skp family chaperone for outer membrane proteins
VGLLCANHDVGQRRGEARAARLLPAAFVALALAAACGEQPPRVAVVDVQEAFQRSPLPMVAAHQIKADLGGAERDLRKRGRALAELRMQLEHGGLELDGEQRARALAKIAEETASLAEDQRRYRRDLEAARQRRGEELIARVEVVARQVARREGMTLLLLKEGALYTEDGALYAGEAHDAGRVDLTDEVARALLAKINPTDIPAAPVAP